MCPQYPLDLPFGVVARLRSDYLDCDCVYLCLGDSSSNHNNLGSSDCLSVLLTATTGGCDDGPRDCPFGILPPSLLLRTGGSLSVPLPSVVLSLRAFRQAKSPVLPGQ